MTPTGVAAAVAVTTIRTARSPHSGNPSPVHT
jgi:hypothetical protein